MEMRIHDLLETSARKRTAGQSQSDVRHPKAILIAIGTNHAGPYFRSHERRRSGKRSRGQMHRLLQAGQTEIGHLGVPLRKQNVLWLHIPVLNVLAMEIIERLSGFAEIA